MLQEQGLLAAPAGASEAALPAERAAITPTHAAQLVRALAAQGALHNRVGPTARHCGPPRLLAARRLQR